MAEIESNHDIVSSIRHEGDKLIIAVKGEIDLHSSPDLRTAILGLLQKTGVKTLVMNLGNVPYMDSSAIAVLVEALQKLRKAGGKVCLTNLQPRVKGLIEIARLNSIFTILNDESDAMK